MNKTPVAWRAAAPVALAAALLAAPALAQNLAVVNGKPVPKARVDALLAQAQRAGQPMSPELEAQARDQVVLREIFVQEAERRGLAQRPAYREQMELARQGVLIRELFEDQRAKSPVTDAQAQAEYDKIKSANSGQEYRARHILVEKEADAKAIIAQLKKGAKFEDLAKKQSKDPGSAPNGGDLGWANPAGYVPEFADAMKKLAKGDVTPEPVKTQFGYHVIRVDDIRDAKAPEPPKFEDIKPQLVQQMEQQKLAKYQEELRAKAKVE